MRMLTFAANRASLVALRKMASDPSVIKNHFNVGKRTLDVVERIKDDEIQKKSNQSVLLFEVPKPILKSLLELAQKDLNDTPHQIQPEKLYIHHAMQVFFSSIRTGASEDVKKTALRFNIPLEYVEAIKKTDYDKLAYALSVGRLEMKPKAGVEAYLRNESNSVLSARRLVMAIG